MVNRWRRELIIKILMKYFEIINPNTIVLVTAIRLRLSPSPLLKFTQLHLERMSRGKYATISDLDRQRVISAFLEDRDWQEAAETLDIKRQTARNIIVKFRRTGQIKKQPRGGNRRPKIDNEMLNFVMQAIERKPTITLKEMNEKLRIELPDKPHVSYQSLSSRLDGAMYTIKDIRPVPAQWNTSERKQERRYFADDDEMTMMTNERRSESPQSFCRRIWC